MRVHAVCISSSMRHDVPSESSQALDHRPQGKMPEARNNTAQWGNTAAYPRRVLNVLDSLRRPKSCCQRTCHTMRVNAVAPGHGCSRMHAGTSQDEHRPVQLLPAHRLLQQHNLLRLKRRLLPLPTFACSTEVRQHNSREFLQQPSGLVQHQWDCLAHSAESVHALEQRILAECHEALLSGSARIAQPSSAGTSSGCACARTVNIADTLAYWLRVPIDSGSRSISSAHGASQLSLEACCVHRDLCCLQISTQRGMPGIQIARSSVHHYFLRTMACSCHSLVPQRRCSKGHGATFQSQHLDTVKL